MGDESRSGEGKGDASSRKHAKKNMETDTGCFLHK
jgi:hypothetical protein